MVSLPTESLEVNTRAVKATSITAGLKLGVRYIYASGEYTPPDDDWGDWFAIGEWNYDE
jgi:hypothetical protein